jgi:hypothetical protein
MKPNIKTLMTALVVMMTVTACSSATTSTTTPGTAPAVTKPAVTTPAATPAQTQPATKPAATTPEVSLFESESSRAFKKSTQLMNDLTSYRMTMVSESDSMGTDLAVTMVMDYFPKKNEYKIITETMGTKTESYQIDGKMYSKTMDNEWQMMTIEPTEQSTVEKVQTIDGKEFDEMFSYEKTGDGYLIKSRRPLTLDELIKLGNRPGDPGSSVSLEDMGELGEEMDMTFEMEIQLDNEYRNKVNHLVTTTKLMDMTITSKMTTTFSDYNNVEPIVLPAEALNAKELTIPEP